MDTDRVAIIDPKDVELKKELDRIDWGKYLSHGVVSVRIRNGKRELIRVERTIQ